MASRRVRGACRHFGIRAAPRQPTVELLVRVPSRVEAALQDAGVGVCALGADVGLSGGRRVLGAAGQRQLEPLGLVALFEVEGDGAGLLVGGGVVQVVPV